MKKIWLYISGGVSFVLFLVLSAIAGHMISDQDTQQMAVRWGNNGERVAQISCFFSPNAQISQDSIEEFEHSIDSKLKEASITSASMNENARQWADAYSADGQITISSDRSTVTLDAIGIGGDFFLFHPLMLLNGSFFSGNDINTDYCVIDEDAAWQLFGSNDVAGMMVNIGGKDHIITGVIRRDDGKLDKAAGLEDTVVYVSYDTLINLGTCNGINHYEIVLPNPVSGFAYDLVKEGIGYNEKEMHLLENSTRYSLKNRLLTLLAFGTRSMNGKSIIYPYWENVARGFEDILALLLLVQCLLLLYPVILAIVFIVKWWKHKSWTFKSVYLQLKDKMERHMEMRRRKKQDEEDEV
ncbi:MAG: ABC transporter permease [Acetatifactor sp.]|nr:ABC transporter permease [Acetatifactor sp.]